MSTHYSPFHRGPDDHDPPPPYVPPLPSAPSTDEWQNQANQLAENMRATSQRANTQHYAPQSSQRSHQNNTSMTSSASRTQGIVRQTSTASTAHTMLPPQPPAGPFYGGPPPAGPFYLSNGRSAAPAPVPAEPRVYPSLQQQTSTSWQAQTEPPRGPLYSSQPPRGPLYNSDTEGVSSYGSTGGTTMFNAMPSRVESSSEISSGSGGRCCNIL